MRLEHAQSNLGVPFNKGQMLLFVMMWLVTSGPPSSERKLNPLAVLGAAVQ
jgi:hypothetical protein